MRPVLHSLVRNVAMQLAAAHVAVTKRLLGFVQNVASKGPEVIFNGISCNNIQDNGSRWRYRHRGCCR